jgi:hypothetical protein
MEKEAENSLNFLDISIRHDSLVLTFTVNQTLPTLLSLPTQTIPLVQNVPLLIR